MLRLRDRHIRLAREDLYTTPIRAGASDPLEYIQDKIWQYGIKIEHRKLGKSAQARHPVIYLGSNWAKKDDGARAGLLAHEFCHCKHQADVAWPSGSRDTALTRDGAGLSGSCATASHSATTGPRGCHRQQRRTGHGTELARSGLTTCSGACRGGTSTSTPGGCSRRWRDGL